MNDRIADVQTDQHLMPPEQRPSFAALAAAAKDSAGLFTCPHCGCHDFRTLRVWHTKEGEKHRTYRCRHCGQHEFNAAVSEIVRPL
jgi:transcription elongation factor Elf1